LDYPGADFPQLVCLSCVQLDGFNGTGGEATHVIGYGYPTVASSINKNGFTLNSIGYSNDPASSEIWDITNVNNLVLKVNLGPGTTPLSMPL